VSILPFGMPQRVINARIFREPEHLARCVVELQLASIPSDLDADAFFADARETMLARVLPALGARDVTPCATYE
jgi:hypothetical protein